MQDMSQCKKEGRLILILDRNRPGSLACIGQLYVDGAPECLILEDVIREPYLPGVPVEIWKVPKATAIPRGIFEVTIDHSDRFNRDMPHILNVPGFTGIRFHILNTAAETEGCLGTGRNLGPNQTILESELAFNAFFPKLKAAIDAAQTVTLEVR